LNKELPDPRNSFAHFVDFCGSKKRGMDLKCSHLSLPVIIEKFMNHNSDKRGTKVGIAIP